MDKSVPLVLGSVIDDQSRCVHYHNENDVIAIKFKCCQNFYACYSCHAEKVDHAAEVWPQEEWNTPAILCARCKNAITIQDYFDCNSICPNCKGAFNPKCANHYHLYFEMNKKDSGG